MLFELSDTMPAAYYAGVTPGCFKGSLQVIRLSLFSDESGKRNNLRLRLSTGGASTVSAPWITERCGRTAGKREIGALSRFMRSKNWLDLSRSRDGHDVTIYSLAHAITRLR